MNIKQLLLGAVAGVAFCPLCPGPVWAQSTSGAANLPSCNKVANFAGVAIATRLATSKPGQNIFICGWHITTSSSGTPVTFAITFGTVTTTECDTGTINVTPALNITANAPSSDHLGSAFTSAAAPNNLCITPSSTTISGVVYYGQT